MIAGVGRMQGGISRPTPAESREPPKAPTLIRI